MKNILKTALLLITIYSFTANNVAAQSLAFFKKYFNEKENISSIEDIKTKNDFDQSKLSIEDIDKRISGLMTDKTIGDYEIPINSKKLKYYGKKNPKEVINFYVPNYERDMPMINKDLEIFNYDGNWILVTDKSSKNYLNVFFAARAFQIMKFKYPEAYNYLISPDQVELGYKKLSPADTKPTLNKLFPIISFDKSPSKIAGSLWNQVFAQEQTREYNGAKWYENSLNALTSINYETDRPKEIYGQSETLKNYWLYLREGLIESIAHEFIHHYITNFKLFDKKADYIFNKRNDSTDKTFSFDAEEAIVINTTETYFVKKGGLSKGLVNFNLNNKYKAKKTVLSDMTVELNKQRFDALKKLSPIQSTVFDEIYRLNIFR